MSDKYIEVPVSLDQWSDEELLAELKQRDQSFIYGFDNEDYEYLLKLVDKMPSDWYTNRVREKLLIGRYGYD